MAVFLSLPLSLRPSRREELLAQLLRGDRRAALLDVQHADAVVLDPGLERLDVVRHHLQDLVGAGEGGVPQFRGADVGDVLVHEVPAQLEGDVGHQPGADDGAVGLVQVPLDRPHGRRRAAVEVLAAGELRRARGAEHEGRPPDPGTPHRVEPQRHLGDVPAHGNPLGLAVRPAPSRAACPGPSSRPRRRPAPARDSTKDSGGEKSSGSQIRLVPEVEVVRRAGSSQTPSIPSRDTDVASEWTTVALRNGIRFMVAQAAVVSSISTAVTVMSRDARAMESAPSPQPRSATWPMPGLREALRVPGRHGEPGGLLQAGLGEDHLPGELAELGLGLGPQPGLGEHGRDQFGGVAGLAQGRVEAEGLVLAVRAQRRQQLPALGGEERGDLVLRCVSHGHQA